MRHKWGCSVVALCVGVCALGSSAAAVGSNVSTGRDLVVIAAKDISPETSRRVAEFIPSVFHVRTRYVGGVEVMSSSPESSALSVSKSVTAADALAVGLVALKGEKSAGLVAAATGNVAILNVEALRPASVKDGKSAEAFNRRIEKETVAAFARLLGLKPCPNPTCAMFRHMTEKELDGKGRDLCPPCQMKADQAMHSLGIDRIEAKGVPSPAPSRAR